MATGLAAAETGSNRSYAGEFDRSGSISLELKRGADKKVQNVYIEGLMGSCDDGQSAMLRFEIDGGTRVLPDRSFAVRAKDEADGGKAIVRGQFSRRFKEVQGTARIYGSIRFKDGERRRCDSGQQEYAATKAG